MNDGDRWFWAADRNDTETMKELIGKRLIPAGLMYSDAPHNQVTYLGKIVGHGNVEITKMLVDAYKQIFADDPMHLVEELYNGRYLAGGIMANILFSVRIGHKKQISVCNDIIDNAILEAIPSLPLHTRGILKERIAKEKSERNSRGL